MAEQLTYVMITPYSLAKSRTGAIISRVISLTQSELVGAHMFLPSDAFVDRLVETFKKSTERDSAFDPLLNYVHENFRTVNPLSITNRVLVLLFKGENAIEQMLTEVVGSAKAGVAGDTVRGSFGDFLAYANGEVKYFEPAVVCGLDEESTKEQLKLLSECAATDGGVIEEAIKFSDPKDVETSLVILKPENFYKRSRRAGNIIDVFSKTGLYVVGAKMLRMTAAQGEEFYGPLKQIFREKLVGKVVDTAKERLADAFAFDIPDEVYGRFGEMLAERNAETEFAKIVEYMTGVDPQSLSAIEKSQASTVQCLALLYRGKGAIGKIRKWLGATDPSKADYGTVRSDFGRDLMQNAAHASDSVASAERERKIVGLWRTEKNPEFKQVIDKYLGGKK